MAIRPELRPDSTPASPRLILLAGATACGKSEIALLLAERLQGEIVSVDSMQVYRGLDLGTAKPSAADRARVPHHLIDVADLTEPFDAARFVNLARVAVADVRTGGRVPILCGGTGLYFKAFLQGLGAAPPADPGLRAELESVPLPELLRELAERDPSTYERIDRRNPRRVVRAVEVVRLAGKPFSGLRAAWNAECRMSNDEWRIGLSRQPDDLRRRIDARVEDMFRRGLVAETAGLMKRGLAENRTAMQALGYRQVVEHLQGKHSLPETIELVKLRTRQFAKRQGTWFRRQLALEWMEIRPNEPASAVVDRFLAHRQGSALARASDAG
jgi:tRNA dimethylallyltransferase